MSVQNRVLALVLVATGVVAVALSLAAGNDTPSVRAGATCGTEITCPDIGHNPDPSVRSVAHITHHENVQLNPRRVEPNTGEHWTITAKYASEEGGDDCNCATEEYEATIEVDWNDIVEAFEINNPAGDTTTPFLGIDLACGDDECKYTGGAIDVWHGYGYRIGVDLAHTVWIDCPIDGWTPFYLDQVLYTTTEVDDGRLLSDETCNYPAVNPGVSPVSETVQVGDNGAWTCTDAGCPTQILLNIKYN